ncbi:hypothetical protein P171DRAFT_35220 [Karstenula rhodostoma CBS 690.94]|uniref:Uncharacterized protein n=1 Tax=Karstenula rhodostoma CBS 690.94 TaxID=1392251 RepID=A0A9P4UBG9_9PLEO|nr:hypothetical protein P171DRAFT_35220 [Karstenula rhodostoma CBS 690.94]
MGRQLSRCPARALRMKGSGNLVDMFIVVAFLPTTTEIRTTTRELHCKHTRIRKYLLGKNMFQKRDICSLLFLALSHNAAPAAVSIPSPLAPPAPPNRATSPIGFCRTRTTAEYPATPFIAENGAFCVRISKRPHGLVVQRVTRSICVMTRSLVRFGVWAAFWRRGERFAIFGCFERSFYENCLFFFFCLFDVRA